MTRKKPRHVSFGTLARVLPLCGSREATHLLHILQCELCREKAITVLDPPPLAAEKEAYDEVFTRVTQKTLEAYAARPRRRRPK